MAPKLDQLTAILKWHHAQAQHVLHMQQNLLLPLAMVNFSSKQKGRCLHQKQHELMVSRLLNPALLHVAHGAEHRNPEGSAW